MMTIRSAHIEEVLDLLIVKRGLSYAEVRAICDEVKRRVE